MAAVLYVFRTLVDDDIPLNAGCLKPLEGHHPRRLMLNPRYPAAVVAGNVETSQSVTNALYGALRRDGVEPGHDEQLHLRQRHATSTTRPSPAAAAPVPRLRRHERGADAHDQLAPDRPRGAGVPLPGAAGELRHPRGLGRRGPLARRRRRRAPDALPRGHDRQRAEQRPAHPVVRHGRRRSPGRSASTASNVPTAASSPSRTSARWRWRRAIVSSPRPRAAGAMARRRAPRRVRAPAPRLLRARQPG
jgi:hypothetical protein